MNNTVYLTLEEFTNMFQTIMGASDSAIIEKSYESWKRHQEYYHSEESVKYRAENDCKYLIWTDHTTAESWINHEKKELERSKRMAEAQRTYMEMPWYERELIGSPIKDIMIEAFIKDEKGIKLRKDLLAWNITADMMFFAIKHFSVYAKINQENIDEVIKNFIDNHSDAIHSLGYGVCEDGGRVFRTILWVCSGFMKEVGETKKEGNDEIPQ